MGDEKIDAWEGRGETGRKTRTCKAAHEESTPELKQNDTFGKSSSLVTEK